MCETESVTVSDSVCEPERVSHPAIAVRRAGIHAFMLAWLSVFDFVFVPPYIHLRCAMVQTNKPCNAE